MQPENSSPQVPASSPVAAISPRALRLGGLTLGVAALAVVVIGVVSRQSDAAALKERANAMAVPTVVLIAPAKPSGGSGALDLPGRLEAQSRAPIYARVSGYLKSWKVDIGAPVKAGQLLAEIETPDLDQQLLQARADLASAQANASLAAATAKRWQSLLASDSVSRQEADEKANDAATKEAMAKAAQANVDRFLATKNFTRIVAPFDGTVTARATDVGALINAGGGGPGQELFVVSDTRKLRVYVSVPQTYVALVKRGSPAQLRVPERPGQVYTAAVESMANAVASGSGAMLIQLAVDNAKGELLPGGFASVRLDLPANAQALSIPPSALIFDKAGLRVATVDSANKVKLKAVTIFRDHGKTIELATGLAPDDRVIESPPDGLAEGDEVRIAQAAPPKAAAR